MRFVRASLLTLTLVGLVAGCQSKSASEEASGSAAAPAAEKGKVDDISGAGATFPYPIYAKWAQAYQQKTGVKLNYQSIGSGGGIKQITASTVDFGASDAPLTPDELKKDGLVQFPMIIGGVVPVVNLPGVAPGALHLTPELLADLFAGKIKKWNDPKVKAANAEVTLPDADVTVVHRADGSGTTWIFTHYLNAVSPDWAAKVGFGKAVSWPTGVGGKGNEGVASYVSRIKGAIGYVEYAYALQNEMTYAKLKNQAGSFVDPTSDTFQAAAANADWAHADGFYLILTNQPGAQSWPITGASFILMHEKQQKPQVAKAVLSFFDWAYANGDDMAKELDYVPMPDEVAGLVRDMWSKKIAGPDGKTVWPAAAGAAQ